MSDVRPTVSVCMLTYNQEKYVRQAIDGVLSQDANFDIEIVVGDDASTDGTAAVCSEYSERGDRVRVFRRERNLGVAENFRLTLNECNGEFVAICEGDDYWTDPAKLQHQVDLLR